MEVVSTNHSQQLCPEVNNETAMQKYLHTHNLTPGYSNIHLISSIYHSTGNLSFAQISTSVDFCHPPPLPTPEAPQPGDT